MIINLNHQVAPTQEVGPFSQDLIQELYINQEWKQATETREKLLSEEELCLDNLKKSQKDKHHRLKS